MEEKLKLFYIKILNGIFWISNPVNPNENFADKWASDPRLEQEFRRWHREMLESLKSNKIRATQEELSGI